MKWLIITEWLSIIAYLAFSKTGELKAGVGIRQILSSTGPDTLILSNGLLMSIKCGIANINDPIPVITIPFPIQTGMWRWVPK